ncbi:MAG: PaaI family thioesterase [Rhodospirillales bacterium]|uniref:PaaI family thioesterase n=1 Tax=Acidiphilium multivorum TaxID=62140 RepID=UPI00238D2C52|nr:PaaI family thioesterase [Rhodospirillales bacterium]
MPDTTPPLPGIDQLRALMESDITLAMGRTLGFHLVEIGEGRVVFEGTPGREVYNPLGTVHGGYAATLLDSACGCAVHTMLTAEQAYSTLELKVSYHRAMTAETGTVRAVGTVISLGRRAGFSEARLTDASGRLYASATSTLIIMQR